MNCSSEPNSKITDHNKGCVGGGGGGGSVSELLNNSYRLQTSHGSSFSSENDLSFSLASDREVNAHNSRHMRNADELPAFEIRLLSPMGRSPSPIDNEIIRQVDNNMSMDLNKRINNEQSPLRMPGIEYVALHDINAQISPPSDADNNNNNNKSNVINRVGSLETIYEGVFLSTPPQPIRKSRIDAWSDSNTNINANTNNNINVNIMKSTRVSLLEKEAFISYQQGKENRANYNLPRAIFTTTTATAAATTATNEQGTLKDNNYLSDT